MTKLVLLLILAAASSFLFLLWYKGSRPEVGEIKQVKIGNKTFGVELALTPAEQAKGLSGRESLSIGTGMYFVFAGASSKTFHMRNMNFPIDIIWIDESMRVVGVERRAQPWKGMIGKLYTSPEPVKYVLEVNAGEAAAINEGDRVSHL